MLNQTQLGEAINVPAASQPVNGFVSGVAYQVGANLFGVAGFTTKVVTNIATGATGLIQGVLWIVGVFTLPKVAAESWVVGDIIYWSPTNQMATKTNASSDLRIGTSIAVVPASTTTAQVRLTPQ